MRRAASRALTGPLPSAVATHPLVADVYLERRFGHECAVLTLLGDDPERFQTEEGLLPSGGRPHQQLQGAVGHLEVVAVVLQVFQVLHHLAEGRAVEVEAELVGLELDGRTARHLAHHETGPVADRIRSDVLVGVARPGDGAGVQPGLVGEGGGADEGLMGIGRDVDQLGDVMGDRREPLEPVGADGADPHLQASGRAPWRSQIGVAGALAVAVDATLDLGHALRTATSELATAQPESLWK